MNFTISHLLTLQLLHPNMVLIGPVVLEKKTLTHCTRRWMPTQRNNSPSDSSYLKISDDRKENNVNFTRNVQKVLE